MDEARTWQAREGMRKVHQDPNQTNGRSRRLKNPYRIDKDFLIRICEERSDEAI